jgi:hypothetical protein
MIKSSHSDSIRAREEYRDSAGGLSLRDHDFAKWMLQSDAIYQRFGANLQHFGKIMPRHGRKISA